MVVLLKRWYRFLSSGCLVLVAPKDLLVIEFLLSSLDVNSLTNSFGFVRNGHVHANVVTMGAQIRIDADQL